MFGDFTLTGHRKAAVTQGQSAVLKFMAGGARSFRTLLHSALLAIVFFYDTTPTLSASYLIDIPQTRQYG